MLLVDAIAYVETHNRPEVGDHGAALSEFQIHREVWQDVHARWGKPDCKPFIDVGQAFTDIGGTNRESRVRALNCARCHIVIIEEYLNRHDVKTSAENIYACWNLGCVGFKLHGFKLDECPERTRRNALIVSKLSDKSPKKKK